MNITLNIGLNVSKHYLPEGVDAMQLNAEYVAEKLYKTLGTNIYMYVAKSKTEQTVIVQYSNVKDVLPKLFRLAHELKQDCIAYQIKDRDVVLGGALVGEYAYQWNYGVFNSLYFITKP